MNVTPETLSWFEGLHLSHGSHSDKENAWCAMEAVAYFAGEPHSDHPKCASRVVTTFAIKLNDRWDDKRRQQLKPFIPRIVGTATTLEVERQRAFLCADWACRELLPMVAGWFGLSKWVERLKALPVVSDAASAARARDLVREARREIAADADAAAYAAADADAAAYAAAAADAAAYAYADAYAAAAYAAAYAAAAADADADADAADAAAYADAADAAAAAYAYADADADAAAYAAAAADAAAYADAADAAAYADAADAAAKRRALRAEADASALALLGRLIEIEGGRSR